MKKRNIALITSVFLLILILLALTGVIPVLKSHEPAFTPVVPPAAPPAPSAPSAFSDDLSVHFLDVGQADSIFIRLPNGQSMLIDAGESDSANTIITYLEDNDCTKIDYLVITHPHADHIGGLPTVIEKMEIGSVYMPRISHTSNLFDKLLTAIENKGLLIDEAEAGAVILSVPGLRADIVAPDREYSNLNNYSAVVKITYGSTAFLFMGDAESQSERVITADVSADILKVGHHGAKTSTSAAFLKRVAPAYAVISVGADNTYKHPSDKILSRLDDLMVKVYRTDLYGTIVFTSDGEAISMKAFRANAPAPALTFTPKQEHEASGTPEPDIVMVWVTASSARYHSRNDCGNMNPEKARQVTLEYAETRYNACSKCH